MKCFDCRLSEFRTNMVVGRGDVPADLLFIGEGPGESEDVIGKPFVGPAGRIFDQIESKVRERTGRTYTRFILNTVMCRPINYFVPEDHDDYGKNRAPTQQEVLTCMPRVMRLIRVVRPKRVIFLGRVPERYYRKEFPDGVFIYHPSFHLRLGGMASPYINRDIRTLSKVVKELK